MSLKYFEQKRLPERSVAGFLKFQNRTAEINIELTQLEDRMEEIQTEVKLARENNDISTLHSLSQQMDMINGKHCSLRGEHQQLQQAQYLRTK